MANEQRSPPQMPKSILRSPGKRAPAPAQGLSTITERSTNPIVPPIPRRSSRRKSGTSSILKRPTTPRPWQEPRASHDTTKTAPPAYDWVPESDGDEDKGNAPIEGDRLAELRRKEGWRSPRRGGWGRLGLILGVVFIVILALAIGLGVGLSHRKKNDSSGTGSSSSDSEVPQKFPLGEYSFVTALMSAQTYCTSNPATWRCYPYNTFSGGDDISSLASFNWIINNTEDDYATADTVTTTPDSGVPANLTVSSANDVFGINFGTKPLTYIASSSNATSSRLTFSFTMPKTVVPSPPITTDGSSAECFFNETVFTGTIYLNANRNYPSGSTADSTSIGGFEQWPHAVEISQTASGGTNVPNCFETVNGNVGAPITNAGLTPLADNLECLCDYRNYF